MPVLFSLFVHSIANNTKESERVCDGYTSNKINRNFMLVVFKEIQLQKFKQFFKLLYPENVDGLCLFSLYSVLQHLLVLKGISLNND